jgi:RNA polymerase sigma-70 factor (ECF subfamily)
MDIESLYRAHGPMVYRRCRKLLGNEAQASDVMQDVFVEILRRDGRLDDRAPMALLLTIATNLCLNQIRNSGRRKTATGDEAIARIINDEAPGTAENRALSLNVLRRLFERQAESTRLIAFLHFVDEMTWEEVAKETGLSVSGVRKRVARLTRESLAKPSKQRRWCVS